MVSTDLEEHEQIDPRFTVLNMALSGKPETRQKSPGKSCGIAWKDKDVEELIELMKEETIIFSLENATKQRKTKVTFSIWQILHTETSIHFKIYCEFLVKQ